MKGVMLGNAIRRRRGEIGLTQAGLAEKITEISRQGVQKWEQGAVPDSSKWDDIESALQVPRGWIVSQMYGGELPPPPSDSGEFTLVPKYKARLSGGNGSYQTSDEIEANFSFRTEWLVTKGSPRHMALFQVEGDSMVPFMYEGDVVLVDRSKNEKVDIVDGKAFAYREGPVIRVKRLSVQDVTIIATSENSNFYPPYEVNMDNFELIGRVLWIGHEVR